jgi:hypothetical protein
MKAKLLLISSILFFLFATIFTIGILLTKDFNDISESSLLKYVVDSEIREIPKIINGNNIVYQSRPTNGTARGINSIKFKPENTNAEREKIINYFTKLGYQKNSPSQLSKNNNGDEITIEDIDNNGLLITKFSFD